MCGITGWISYDRDQNRAPGASDVMDAMTRTMACRGPDDCGTWAKGPAALGHRRLAVIDLPGGHQPMTVRGAADRTVALVHSGEVYNYRELRDELVRRGHRFTTESDTEVVVRGYLEWGEAVAGRLNGMYAFALWDDRDQRLVLVRDRLGVKPLYYYPTADGVLFGSEPKAILANPLARRSVSLDGLREVFAFIKTPGHAVWDGMYEVEPGTLVTVDRGGLRHRRYWALETRPHPDGREASVATVRSLLEDIVDRQLVSDVPLCTLLSGGLDSSVITALAARRMEAAGKEVRSFAVDFLGQADAFVADDLRATPDAPYVHDVARRPGIAHQDIVLDSLALADPAVRAEIIRARDMPVSLGQLDASLYLLFKAVRERSTVALSGEAADEVFGGYKWFFTPETRDADTFPWILQFAENFGDEGNNLRGELVEALDIVSYIQDGYLAACKEVQRLDGEDDTEFRMRRLSYLHATRFLRLLLDRKDRMSMAVGLEVRVPFCDHRLVEYVYNAPWSVKTFDGREKSLLREATADLLPKSVYDRAKSPYPLSHDPAYAAAIQAQAEDLLSTPAHRVFDIVDHDWLRRMAHRDPSRVTEPARWGIERSLDLAVWLETYAPDIALP
ncbi:asparagine synthase (glutamine-hydrolyzing) [Streptomyces sp. NPDC045431]|uniref:asparagine synthase (glutamine-hydrolyzing) n=1 Tax=Streptomyces sp. NPDC045431 TaxID=3155613 RepID=UPI0033DBD124